MKILSVYFSISLLFFFVNLNAASNLSKHHKRSYKGEDIDVESSLEYVHVLDSLKDSESFEEIKSSWKECVSESLKERGLESEVEYLDNLELYEDGMEITLDKDGKKSFIVLDFKEDGVCSHKNYYLAEYDGKEFKNWAPIDEARGMAEFCDIEYSREFISQTSGGRVCFNDQVADKTILPFVDLYIKESCNLHSHTCIEYAMCPEGDYDGLFPNDYLQPPFVGIYAFFPTSSYADCTAKPNHPSCAFCLGPRDECIYGYKESFPRSNYQIFRDPDGQRMVQVHVHYNIQDSNDGAMSRVLITAYCRNDEDGSDCYPKKVDPQRCAGSCELSYLYYATCTDSTYFLCATVKKWMEDGNL